MITGSDISVFFHVKGRRRNMNPMGNVWQMSETDKAATMNLKEEKLTR